MSRALELSEDVIKNAESTYRECVELGLIEGKNAELIIQAVLFASCGEMEPAERLRILNELESASGVAKSEIFDTCSEVLQAHYVASYANALGLGDEVTKPAMQLLANAMRLKPMRTRLLGKPNVAAAAAVYIAATCAEEHKTEDRLSEVSGFGRCTIRNWSRFVEEAAEVPMKFNEILEIVRVLNLPLGEYALFGSVPLAAHGIRDCRDIDVVVLPELYDRLKTQSGWKEKALQDGTNILVKGNIELYVDWWCGQYRPDIKKLVEEAEMIDGVPVVLLDEVLVWKRSSHKEKDLKDVKLIEEYLRAPAGEKR